MTYWTEKVFGHVRAIVRGRVPEAFINRCVRDGVRIKDIRRIDQTSMAFTLALADVKRIRPILRATDCRIRFLDRRGFPFLMMRLTSRAGIVVGCVAGLFALFLLSNMVWNIEIDGADPKLEQQIRTSLKKMNVHVGSIEFFLPPLATIEGKLAGELDEATWVGVSKDGTTYRIEVVQKELPEDKESLEPRDLVAAKEARIKKMFVEKGVAKVETDTVVSPGDLLVSGAIGKDGNPTFVAAKGEVIGETWYRSTTTVPLKMTYQTFTGKTYTKHRLSVFGFDVPIWGWKARPFAHAKQETVEKPFHFLFWDLPISYKKVIVRATDVTHRQLNEAEAVKAGRENARKELLSQLPKGAKITFESVERRAVENGAVRLNLFFTVEENIAKPRPFIPEQRRQSLQKKQKEKPVP